MNKKASPRAKPKTKFKKVEFSLHFPDAEGVFLAGDFNNWNVTTLPMKKDGEGIWEVDVGLTPGRYEYRFWVNGVWHNDPEAHEVVENPFGSQNCVRIVT